MIARPHLAPRSPNVGAPAPSQVPRHQRAHMSESSPGWSTPKFFLILFAVALVTAFTINAVFNELLQLELGGASIGAAIGVITVLLLPRWSVIQQRTKQSSQQRKDG